MFWIVCAFATTPAFVLEARENVDWPALTEEATGWMSQYLATNTVNPPGNERDGAQFLSDLLSSEGIETRFIDHSENRASLVARLRSGSDLPPLCLLSHIDVVPFEADKWHGEPLSGDVVDGMIIGRGALDMKGMGIMQAAAMIQLARDRQNLRRDVVLLAVADEEVGGMGIKAVMEQWDSIGCSEMINEGGLGLQDALFEGQTVHGISVEEKGVLWVKMIASGEPGHGSTIHEGEAPLSLLEGMSLVEKKYKPKPDMHPTMSEMLKRIGENKGGMTGAILKSKVGRSLFVKPTLMKGSTTSALITNTVHLTGMSGASSTNVVPSEVWASYDCRLLPGTDPDEFLVKLQEITKNMPNIRWEVQHTMISNGSPLNDPFFERIAHYVAEDDDSGVAVPILSPGFTDSIHARPYGVKAYGFLPVVVTRDQSSSMHGHNEELSVANLGHGVRVVYSLVLDTAGAKGHHAPREPEPEPEPEQEGSEEKDSIVRPNEEPVAHPHKE